MQPRPNQLGVPHAIIAIFVMSWLSCALVVHTHRMPANIIAQWRKQAPEHVPPNIRTEAELSSITRYISPVLAGGFGNILFELAASHSVALRLNVTCLVAWWDQEHVQSPLHRPYHGRGDPVPGITLKHVFPNIVYVDFNPAYRNVQEHAFVQTGQSHGTVVEYSESLLSLTTPYLAGYFQHKHCMGLMLRKCCQSN